LTGLRGLARRRITAGEGVAGGGRPVDD